MQELSGSTPTANLLTGGVDQTFSRTDSTGTFTPLTDALGSTVALTDSTGAIQTQYTYEPFGNTTASGPASTNSFQYTGRENDGTGVYFYRARYYSPIYQRFISEDPIGFAGGGPNFYGYVGGNPLRYRDPFGLSASSAASCFFKGAAVGAVGALVVGAVAVGAAAVAPVAVVTVGLGAVAVVGITALAWDSGWNIANGNWDGLAYNLGSAVGAIVVGGFGGRAIAEGINGVPSPPWSWNSDVGDMYDPNFPGGSVGRWFGKGPNPASAGGSAAGAGAGAATAGRGACGGC